LAALVQLNCPRGRWNILVGKLVAPSEKVTMREFLFNGLIYLLGFVGLAAVGLIPCRVWQVLRDTLKGGRQIRNIVLAFLAIFFAVVALWSDVYIAGRVFKCLARTYCGPSIASGWVYLAMLGVVYIIFEIICFAIRKACRAKEVGPVI